jgi:hypothetical protein
LECRARAELALTDTVFFRQELPQVFTDCARNFLPRNSHAAPPNVRQHDGIRNLLPCILKVGPALVAQQAKRSVVMVCR